MLKLLEAVRFLRHFKLEQWEGDLELLLLKENIRRQNKDISVYLTMLEENEVEWTI